MLSNVVYKLNKISKYYGKKAALSSLSVEIKKGELVALIGPSGAGKTTLLNILGHIINQDSGDIKVDGYSFDKYKSNKDLAKKIGVIRQQFDLVGQLPVIHNVLAGRLNEWNFLKSLLSLIIPQDKKSAISALDRVGLKDKIYDKTVNLSGGEQQRVALARILLQNPEIILADEPVASLDPARSEDILCMLIKISKEENQTLITSIHSVDYAKKYFDRIIALRDGEIFFDKKSIEVTEKDLLNLYDLKELN